MQPLDRTLRRQLENTVKEAREVAEAAARAAVDHLGVAEGKPPAFLSPTEKELRRRLRTHGRQLGDERHAKSDTQETERLVEEVAYEHWHRMLFARFLAENNLLMYPDPDDPVSVTLAECEELAGEEGAKNGWELAARFAAKMLPQIFRPDSPVFELVLPPEHQQQLENLLAGLSKKVFQASDSLGWVYQFWQAKRKDEVNASEVKIGARELPSVTQLFTEPYMVAFLLDNTLGAWWAGQKLTQEDLRAAKSEKELRQKAALPEMPLEYLRFVQEDRVWHPAAGTFSGWPRHAKNLKVLDPCCGSGHFLVAAFKVLVQLRMIEESLLVEDSVDAVLRDNLRGLEIDERCCQIAAFNVAMAAWKLGGYRELPELHIACSGIGPQCSEEEWLRLAEASGIPMPTNGREPIENGLLHLHQLFSQAPTLGSLIDPMSVSSDLLLADYETVRPYLTATLEGEKSDEEIRERAVAAAGMVRAVELLTSDYTLVITNVPYLGRGKQDPILQRWCEKNEPDSKADLATAFISRSFKWLARGGSVAVVSPENWLVLNTYTSFRKWLFRHCEWNIDARLGSNAFRDMNWWAATTNLLTWTLREAAADHILFGIDVGGDKAQDAKAAMLRGDRSCQLKFVSQCSQRDNPESMVTLEQVKPSQSLSNFAWVSEGISRGDSDQFDRMYWELSYPDAAVWMPLINPTATDGYFDGRQTCFRWDQGAGALAAHPSARLMGLDYWGRDGVFASRTGRLRTTLTIGTPHSQIGAAIVPKDPMHLAPLFAFCRSKHFAEAVRKLSQKMIVPTRNLGQVSFDLLHWQAVAAEKFPDGLPEPESDDATQSIFHGRPESSTQPLQVAVARMLGYRWPTEQNDEMRLSGRARDLVKRCDDLLSLADKDGIVCIPPVRGEPSAADRLVDLLANAFGAAWAPGKLNELLKSVGHEGKSLEGWLRDKFFEQHCQLFHQRPFIWHIWDGLRDGFSVLVNYHKLNRKNLETLIYTYLGDWITRQKQDQTHGIDGAEERIAAAENLKRKLELILAGESPYDIFVRWKPLAEQPIGWEPDLNDGVRLNIRPFMSGPDVKARGAGVLRIKPKIDWKKDRGKDVESAPWYSLGPQYGGKEGDRINDHHLTLAEKNAARMTEQECVARKDPQGLS